MDEHINYSNVFGALAYPDQSTAYITYLGIFNNEQDCITYCINNGTSNNKCESFTWMTSTYYSKGYQKHCYGLFGKQYGSVWSIAPDNGSITGRIIYKCNNNIDCSLNGKCNIITGN